MEMMTLQPKNRLKGKNGHSRRTPQRAEKGTEDSLNASSPTWKKQPHTAVLCGRDLLQDAVAQPPGMGGLKFRKKRENNPPKEPKDQVLRKLPSRYVPEQGESTEKVSLHAHSVVLLFPQHLLLMETGYGARWSSAVSGQAVL